MTKTVRSHQCQEIEAMNETKTQLPKVVALHPTAQPEMVTGATEAQPSATEMQSDLTFPATKTAIAKVLKVSRQQVAKDLTKLRYVYDSFPEYKIEEGAKVTEEGFEAILEMKNSPLNGKDYLNHLRKELQTKTTQENLKPAMTSSAMVVSPQPDYEGAIAKMSQSIQSLSQTQEQILQGLESMKDSQHNLNLMGAMAGASSAKQVLTHEMQSFMANYTQGKAELNNTMVAFLSAINNPQDREADNEQNH